MTQTAHAEPHAAPEPAPLVEVRDVSFSFGEIPVLQNVSLDIRQDDFLAVIGPNGGGKSTLVRLILGLLRPASGSIRVLGDTPKRAAKHVGYVPQHAKFDRDFPASVRDVVAMGRLSASALGKRYSAADRAAVERVVAELELTAFVDRPLRALSGGELQRVLVARALVCEPKLLLLDEPTSSVDSRVEEAFYERLKDLNQRIPIVLVSHDLGFISAYVKRVACLNRRIEVKAVSDVHAHDLEAMYGAPVKAWAHDCKL
jgi:zinc transport system ATP-binding protein